MMFAFGILAAACLVAAIGICFLSGWLQLGLLTVPTTCVAMSLAGATYKPMLVISVVILAGLMLFWIGAAIVHMLRSKQKISGDSFLGLMEVALRLHDREQSIFAIVLAATSVCAGTYLTMLLTTGSVL